VLNADYAAGKYLSLQTRVQGSRYRQSNGPTRGYAIMQDVQVDTGKLKVSTRFALFDTEDYDNRQYAYEKDVLYAFSLPAYNGRGTRQYLLLQYPWAAPGRLAALRPHPTARQRHHQFGLEEINAPHNRK
jgi:hypothetical protein